MQNPKTNANHERPRGRPRGGDLVAASLCEVLNLVRLGQADTRQEIERTSAFGRAIVADRLVTLGELGLIDEAGTGVATGGRAPRLVQFCKERARIVVITLNQSALGVGIADLSGQLLTEHHEPGDLAEPRACIDRISALVRWIVSRQAKVTDLWGISISVPGPVIANPAERFIRTTPDFLHDWGNSGLVETLLREFQTPVWISSSVEAMTMGELHGGAGQGETSMLFVKTGKRIGAGLVAVGRPYHGASGAVGLIGQLPVTADGQTGSLDRMAGTDMIEAQGRDAAATGESSALAELLSRNLPITAHEVCQAAQMGDPASTAIISRSGHLIGGVIATLASMLNPSLIVLAGSVAQTNDILLAAVRETVYGVSHPLVTRDLRIVRSQMGASAALLGAASIAVEALFTPSVLRDWIMSGSPVHHPEMVESLASANRSEPKVQSVAPPPPAAIRT